MISLCDGASSSNIADLVKVGLIVERLVEPGVTLARRVQSVEFIAHNVTEKATSVDLDLRPATLTSVHRVSGREYPTWSVKLRNAPDKVRDTDFDYLREVHGMLHQLELPEGAEMGKGLRLTYTCDCPGRHHAQSVAEDRCPKYRTQLRIPVSKEGRRYTINQESVVGYSSSDPGVLSLNNHEMRVLKESIESSWPDRERIFNDFAVKSNSQIASVESDTIGLRSNEL